MRVGTLLPRLRRFVAAVAALAAISGLAARELATHLHGFDEVDLVGHAIAEPALPHEISAHQPLHLEAERDAEHKACIDCMLQALAPDLGAAAPAVGSNLAVLEELRPLPELAHLSASFEAASPRGPPSAA